MFGLEYFRHWFGARHVIVSPMTVNNPLAGKPLRYLIGADKDDITIAPGVVTVLPFDYDKVILDPLAVVGYCNLFWQKGAPDCAPYLGDTDTSKNYSERVIDPRGRGWLINLNWQFSRWKKLGAVYIELDNPDAYEIEHVIGAIELAAGFGLKVIAKNPGLMEHDDSETYVTHPNIYGIIVEKGAGGPVLMDLIRHDAGKPDLPVWFVFFGDGRSWADEIARAVKPYRNMSVTYSEGGEYVTSVDV